MLDRAAFVGRIAAAVFAGRRKLPVWQHRPWKGDHYEHVAARLYAHDVASKLLGLFREETIWISGPSS